MRRFPVQTKNPTKARPESRTRRRRGVVAACIAAALLAGVGAKLWLDHRVPSPDADAGRVSRYMSGPAFAALPDARKAPYLDAFQRASDRGELTPEEQRGVIGNLNRGGKDPIRQYFSLPPGREREKFLDDVIDRVLKSEKEAKLPPPPDKKGEKPIRIDGGRLADAIPPEDRARMGQFLQDLHDRRTARGLPDDGKFLFKRTP
jgi:hypothetical protein